MQNAFGASAIAMSLSSIALIIAVKSVALSDAVGLALSSSSTDPLCLLPSATARDLHIPDDFIFVNDVDQITFSDSSLVISLGSTGSSVPLLCVCSNSLKADCCAFSHSIRCFAR